LSSGRLAVCVWSSGRLVVWSSGRLDWSSGRLVVWSGRLVVFNEKKEEFKAMLVKGVKATPFQLLTK